MRTSYLRVLLILLTFQIVAGQEESSSPDWGIHVGYATQQAFRLKTKTTNLPNITSWGK